MILNLKEIFHFYSRKKIKSNQRFEELQYNVGNIDLGIFSIFCSEFKIKLPKT